MSKLVMTQVVRFRILLTVNCWTFLWLVLFVGSQVKAQMGASFYITKEDGLPSNTIYQVLQDAKGFIWFGTDNGLFVFNGYEYLPIKGTGIDDAEILKLAEDNQGQIWFLNNSKQLFFVENLQAKRFDSTYQSKRKLAVRNFLIDKEQNNLWLIVEKEKQADNSYRQQILVFKNFKEWIDIELPFKSYNLSHIRIENNHVLFSTSFLTSNGREYRLGAVNKEFLALEKYKLILSSSLKGEYLWMCLVDGEKGLAWGKSGTYLIDGRKLIKINTNIELGRVNNVFKESDDKWLIITQKGVFFFDLNKQLYKELDVKGNISSFCQTQENLTFFGSIDRGVQVIGDNNFLSVEYFNQDVLKIYLRDSLNAILGMRKGRFTNFKIGDIPHVDQLDNSINVRIIQDFLNDTIIIGGDKALYFYDLSRNSLSTWHEDSNVKYLEYRNEDLFIIVDEVLRTPKLNEMRNYNHVLFAKSKVLFKNAKHIYKDSRDYIWLSSRDGLFLSKEKNNFQYVPVGKDTMPINRVVEMDSNEIVVATTDKLWFLKNLVLMESVDISKGTNFLNVKDLKFQDSLLYIATNQGVAIFNPQTQEIEDWINEYDGLPSNDVNTIALGEDNKLWIGTKKGLAIVDLTKLTKNTTPPPIYITNVKVMEQDTTLHETYTLPYNQNSIQIDYVGLAYRARGDVRYQYRMKGIDTTWVTTTSRYARFPGLSSGEYTFEVIALNEDDTPSAKPATVSFEVTPPYWMTWWFWSVCGLVVLGVLSWAVYRRYARLKRERAFEKQIAALKMEALQSQMNPHFIFNALNAVQSFITSGEDEQAMFYLAKFAKLIRSIFEYSGQTSISLDEEIDFLNLYLELERLRFGDKVNAAMFVEPELLKDAQDIYVPPLLIQPIVENAFKHGLLHKKGIGNLSIKFTFALDTKEGILCIIEDDGVGREYTKALKKSKSAHNSAGLTVTKNRLSILHKGASLPVPPFQIKDLVDQKQKAIGTRVEIIL